MERKGFGRLIREGREARGWTQVEFAERMNASPTTVSNWEREHTAPGLEDINPMVSLLPFSAEALLTALGIQMMPPAAAKLPKTLVHSLLQLTPDELAWIERLSDGLPGSRGQ